MRKLGARLRVNRDAFDMERFSIFNDRTSGVNPFTVQPYRPTAAQSAVSGLVLALKAPFLALCVAVLYGVDCFVRVVSATR